MQVQHTNHKQEPSNKQYQILFVFNPQDADSIGYSILAYTILKKQPLFNIHIHIFQRAKKNPYEMIQKVDANHLLQNTNLQYFKLEIHPVDFVVLIGDNWVLSKVFSLYQEINTPPILGLGNADEVSSFNFITCDIEKVLQNFSKQVKANNIKCQQLMKLAVYDKNNKLISEFGNDLEVYRGHSSVIKMQIMLKNPCLKKPLLLADLWGDGVIIATSMGSTNKSIKFHGPIFHKELQSIIIVPICPLSLNFRPICLPVDHEIILKLQKQSRSIGLLGFDGISGPKILQQEEIIIKHSKNKIRLIKDLNRSYEESWIIGLRHMLNWADNFSSN